MKNAAFSIEELFRFLDAGVSAFHSTAAAAAILEAEGYVNCPESAAWELAPGGKYYTTRNGSAVLAWRMPKGELTGWHAAASHSDSPTWRIKQFDTEDKVFAKAEVEGYGGMIMPSWLDRPLTVAGRLLVRTESGIESRLVCPDRALACIPNLCIHFSRDLNNGMKYNPQVDLQPIFGINGMGRMMLSALREKDIPTVMAGVIITAIMIALGNLVADLLYGVVDPRIRAVYTSGGKKLKKKEAAA